MSRHRARSGLSRGGILRVVALPWGEVAIDGRDAGAAPVTVRLSAGEHAVVIDGAQRFVRSVRMENGAVRVIVVGAN